MVTKQKMEELEQPYRPRGMSSDVVKTTAALEPAVVECDEEGIGVTGQ